MKYVLCSIFILTALRIYPVSVERIIEEHPLYLAALSKEGASKLSLDREYLSYIPTSGNFAINNSSQVENAELDLTLSFSLDYKLFDTEISKSIKSKNILLDISTEYKESIYQYLKYKIYKLQLNYISSRRLYELAVENYDSIESYTKKIEERFISGDISKSELSYAQSILLRNRAILIDAKHNIDKARRQYYQETNYEIDVENNYIEYNIVLDNEINDIIYNSPDIKQALLYVSETNNRIKYSKSNTIPNITLSSSFYYPLDSRSSWRAGVNITIPISGIKYDSLLKKELSYELESRNSELEQSVKDLKSRIDNIQKRITTVESKLKLYYESLKLSNESLTGVLIESKEGVRTVFDVIESNNNVSSIQKYIINSENELNNLKLEYHYLVGGFSRHETR